jgi:glycosyltransferase involved in cell wall biosynthesis
MVILEAMALGKPVVAGAEGGPQEIITDGVNGLFAPFGDPERLASQIDRYLGNPGFARKVGENARHRSKDFQHNTFSYRLRRALAHFGIASNTSRKQDRLLSFGNT